jgi:CRP-like cAMP-binding protein
MQVDAQRLQLLRRVWLFSQLEDAELAPIGAVARERSCLAGEVLVSQGDTSGDLFSVVHGRVKIASVAGSGEEILLSVLGPGDVFGEIALLDDEPRSATVVAAEPCRLLVVPRVAFRALLSQMPILALRLLALMARQVRRLSSRTEDSASLDVRGRLAKALLSISERFGSAGPGANVRITLKLSQADLGQMVGATREMVNKCLREWVGSRIIRCNRGAVTMVDETRLRPIAAGQPSRRERGRAVRARARRRS